MPRQPHIFSSGDRATVPDHVRCKRSDGRSWRCPLRALPGISLCAHHRDRLLKNNSQKKPACEKHVSEKQVSAPVEEKKVEKQVVAAKVEKKQVEKQVAEKRIRKKRRRLLEEDGKEGKKVGQKTRRSTEQEIEEMPKKVLEKRGKKKKRRRLVGEIEGLAKLREATPPDHLRCKRSDGRGWRCYHRRSLPHSFCPHHLALYIKSNSLKATAKNLDLVKERKKEKRRMSEVMDELVRLALRREMERRKEKGRRRPGRKLKQLTMELPNGVMVIATENALVNLLAEGGNVGPTVDRKLGFDGGAVLWRCFRSKNVQPAPIGSKKRLPCGRGLGRKMKRLCHGCEQKAVLMTCCSKCKTFFCSTCIKSRYSGMSEQEVKMSCSLCLCSCSCNVCMPPGHEADKDKELVTSQPRYSNHVVCELLPTLKEINWEQTIELEIEANNQGRMLSDVQLQLAECRRDELQKCSYCDTSITDIHRCCSKCSLKLCISCCREVRLRTKREAQIVENGHSKRIKVCRLKSFQGLKQGLSIENKSAKSVFYLSTLLNKQKLKTNSQSLFCPPKILGGCGDGILNLEIAVPFGSLGLEET